jgi:hypothetical protein
VRSEVEPSCAEVSALLSDAPDGRVSLGGPARRHVDACLRCQAEAATYRRLRRELRALRAEPLAAPADLLADLLEALPEGRARRTGRRVAYVGGLAAATAAGVGGVIVLASRTRRRLPLAG